MLREVAPFFEIPPYALPQTRKTALLTDALNALCRYHTDRCDAYRAILNAQDEILDHDKPLAELPWLPVPLFKHLDLVSTDTVYKTITSSGTTDMRRSRIYLDQETARLQTRALVMIMQSFLGKKRLPMLIVDTPSTTRDRTKFSARAAGILGLSTFGRDHTYLLDDDSVLQKVRLHDFLHRHQDEPILIFGFTFMLWLGLYEQLQAGEVDLSRAVLFHSGGWKKMAERAVDNRTFKEALKSRTGIERIHNFYGMAEQVGSVFVECEAGHLHTPAFAEILIRDPLTLAPLPVGETGLIELLSVIPHSYPGHVLLSEDMGAWLGVDDCPCGRKGRYFVVHGRAKAAEPRGCSDLAKGLG